MKKALLIGCNYTGTDSELYGCINDVNNVRSMLIAHYNYLPSNIMLLTDNTIIKPTLANIIKAFAWLQTSASAFQFGQAQTTWQALPPNSYAYFHYSGHGSTFKDLTDTLNHQGEAIVPLDYSINGMITDNQIRKVLVNTFPSTSILTSVLDSCYSQNQFDLAWGIKMSGNIASLFRAENEPETGSDITMMSGSSKDQTSADTKYGGQPAGALTASYIQVLANKLYLPIQCNILLTNVRQFIVSKKLSSQTPYISFGKIKSPYSIFPL